jgi:hypothetical protein
MKLQKLTQEQIKEVFEKGETTVQIDGRLSDEQLDEIIKKMYDDMHEQFLRFYRKYAPEKTHFNDVVTILATTYGNLIGTSAVNLLISCGNGSAIEEYLKGIASVAHGVLIRHLNDLKNEGRDKC